MEAFIITITLIVICTGIGYNKSIEWQKVSTIEKNIQNQREINIIEATSKAKINENEILSKIKREESEQKFYQDSIDEKTQSINRLLDTINKQFEISNNLQLHVSNNQVQQSLSNDVYTRMEVMRFCKVDMGVKNNKELNNCIRQTVNGEFLIDEDEFNDEFNDEKSTKVIIINN